MTTPPHLPYYVNVLCLSLRHEVQFRKGFSLSLFFQLFGVELLSTIGRSLLSTLHLLSLPNPIIMSLSAEEGTSPIWIFSPHSHLWWDGSMKAVMDCKSVSVYFALVFAVIIMFTTNMFLQSLENYFHGSVSYKVLTTTGQRANHLFSCILRLFFPALPHIPVTRLSL